MSLRHSSENFLPNSKVRNTNEQNPIGPRHHRAAVQGPGSKARNGTGLLVKMAEQAGPGCKCAAASRASTFGDGNDLYGDTLLPQKKELHCVTLNLYSITSLQNTMNRP